MHKITDRWEQSLHDKTYELYEPLRKTFMEDTTAKKTELLYASNYSHISCQIKTRTIAENAKLANQTLIFNGKKLHATHKIQKIPPNAQYSIVNSIEKVYDPISEQELQFILKNKPSQQEIIVYTEDNSSQKQLQEDFSKSSQNQVQGPQKVQSNLYFHRNHSYAINSILNKKAKLEIPDTQEPTQRKKNQNVDQTHSEYNGWKINLIAKRGSGTIMPEKPKYNFFSILDQPIESCRSGQKCQFPSTQLCAEEINEISWYGTISR